MKALEQEVLHRAGSWLDSGKVVYLCTIVTCVGSSPRPVGSLLACIESGEQIGSLSGGCVEEDLLAKIAGGEFVGGAPALIEYGVSAQENERLGLPCGGRLQVLVQRVDPAEAGGEWLRGILQALQQRRGIRRVLNLNSGVTELSQAKRFQALQLSDTHLEQSFGPRMRMLLVGAGQLSQSLAELALAMDYELIVTDPRPAMLQQWNGPDVELLPGMPDDVIRRCANDSHSVVITLTHDPRIDDMALMEALTTDAWYVGALGSRRTTVKRLQRLRQLGVSEQQVQRLHAPVGLDIGSKTPIEIAIAIMAQLTSLQRQGKSV